MNSTDKKASENAFFPDHTAESVALAYIKPIATKMGNGFAIHAADGTQLAIFASRDAAMIAARQHDLEPVHIH